MVCKYWMWMKTRKLNSRLFVLLSLLKGQPRPSFSSSLTKCCLLSLFLTLTIEHREAPLLVTRTRTSHHGREIQQRRWFIVQRVEGSNSLHLESRKRRTYRHLPWTQGYRMGSGPRSLFELSVDRERRRDGKTLELRNRRMHPNLPTQGSGQRSLLVRWQQPFRYYQRPLCGAQC